ncbi:MAG: beta-N-acetylhexosaminidase [Bdellovibrionales bacterium]|nr:beta-N-acetylhexosaminidase [Bdellovibrionales bacterium]
MEHIGQLFIIGIQGTELSKEEADFMVNNDISGVCLFGRNVDNPKQIHKLCSDIHALSHRTASKAPMIISIDMEGGRVHRLKAPFTQWPALAKLGELDSTSVAFKFASMMAAELLAVGINLDFAPCMDVLTNPDNPVIGDRSISADPEKVTKISSALVRGYIKGGVIPCGKHFPGHGNTLVDSHEELPKESTSLEKLNDCELQPFKKAFRARLDMVMTGHILFENVDADNPVTLSEKFLKQILRDDLRYRGIVISDDLDMKALRNHHEVEHIPVAAMKAGCDMLLYCNEFDTPPKGLEAVKAAIASGEIDKAQVEESLKRVAEMKTARLKDFSMPEFKEAAKIIGHPDHLKLSKGISEGSVPVDMLTT